MEESGIAAGEQPSEPFIACPKTLSASLPQEPDSACLKLASLAAHKHMFLSRYRLKNEAEATAHASYSALRIKSLSLMPKADAKALATSIPTLTLPSSTELM